MGFYDDKILGNTDEVQEFAFCSINMSIWAGPKASYILDVSCYEHQWGPSSYLDCWWILTLAKLVYS